MEERVESRELILVIIDCELDGCTAWCGEFGRVDSLSISSGLLRQVRIRSGSGWRYSRYSEGESR